MSPRRRLGGPPAEAASEPEELHGELPDGALDLFDEVPVEGETAVDAAYRAVDQAVARERIRIARELHDGLAADLATSVALFKYYFESASTGDGEDAQAVLRNIQEILEGLLVSTRNTLRTMRPRRLGTSSVVLELRKTAEEIGRLHGIRVEIWTSGREEDLTAGQREVVYHIVREALINVRRHSGATMSRVRLGFAAKPFLIEVSDEGKGFEANNPSGYGLVGMRERAAGIGGRLEVVTTPGRGTTVFLFGPEAAGVN